jgi:hypothetical protein
MSALGVDSAVFATRDIEQAVAYERAAGRKSTPFARSAFSSVLLLHRGDLQAEGT